MKHATDASLDAVDDLLAQVRRIPGLTEKKRGVFYRKSRAFLHFHEDPSGMYADLRVADEWERFCVTVADEREAFIGRLEFFAGSVAG